MRYSQLFPGTQQNIEICSNGKDTEVVRTTEAGTWCGKQTIKQTFSKHQQYTADTTVETIVC